MKIKFPHYFLIIFTIVFNFGCSKDSSVIEDAVIVEDDTITLESVYKDILTPAYYLTSIDISFKNEVNQFVNTVQNIQFGHPLEGLNLVIPSFVVKGNYGSTKGTGTSTQYHPAVDMHVGNSQKNVNLYAVHDGYISTARDVDKYRQYVAITKNIEDNTGQLIGKLVTIYAHVDLDLDAPESLFQEGDYVSKGTLISKNLYAETVGGPHLHFEVRYYRATDIGNETFYGGNVAGLTQPSAGDWLYGYWNTTVGYGFGNPKNHELFLY